MLRDISGTGQLNHYCSLTSVHQEPGAQVSSLCAIVLTDW